MTNVMWMLFIGTGLLALSYAALWVLAVVVWMRLGDLKGQVEAASRRRKAAAEGRD